MSNAADKYAQYYSQKYGKKQNTGSSTSNISTANVASGAKTGYDIWDAVDSGADLEGTTGSYLSMAGDAYSGLRGALDPTKTKKEQAIAAQDAGGMMVADYFTGGLASAGRGVVEKTPLGKPLNKVIDLGWKLSPSTYILPKTGLFGGVSTKQEQLMRAKALVEANVTGYEDYKKNAMASEPFTSNYNGNVNGNLAPDYQGFDPTFGYTNNVFAGSRDEGALNPYDTWGSDAMFELYGNDYLGKMTEKQRFDINAALLNEGLVRESRGGISITDAARAQAIKDEILSGKYQAKEGAKQFEYLTQDKRPTGTYVESGGQLPEEAPSASSGGNFTINISSPQMPRATQYDAKKAIADNIIAGVVDKGAQQVSGSGTTDYLPFMVGKKRRI